MLTRRVGIGRTMLVGGVIALIGQLVVPLAAGPPLLAGGVIGIGRALYAFELPMVNVPAISMWQAVTPPALIGRVTATGRMLTRGAGPLGALVGGVAGEAFGLRVTLALGAALIAVAVAIWGLSPVRHIRVLADARPTPAPQPPERRGAYFLSVDRRRLDVELIARFLQNDSYWAQQRTRDQIARSIEGSWLCIGLYHGDPARPGARQVGFARVVSDGATFGWLCDVFVHADHRGHGLAKWLIAATVARPEVDSLSLFVLATRDAHGLYQRYGEFEPLPQPERWMRRRRGA